MKKVIYLTIQIILRTWLTFISHVAVDLWSSVPFSEFNPLHMALHCLLDDIAQRLVLRHVIKKKLGYC